MKKYTRVFTIIALVVICDTFLSMDLAWCKDGADKPKELPGGLQRLMTARDMINTEIIREQNKIPSLMKLGVDRTSLDQAILYKKQAASALNRAIREWTRYPGPIIIRAKNLMQSAAMFENEDILAAARGEAGTLHAQSVSQEAQEAIQYMEPILHLLDGLVHEFQIPGTGGGQKK